MKDKKIKFDVEEEHQPFEKNIVNPTKSFNLDTISKEVGKYNNFTTTELEYKLENEKMDNETFNQILKILKDRK